MQDFCFHIHTPRCGHADKTMWEDKIAQYFCEAGFKTIAFTDHSPWKTLLKNFPRHSMEWDEKDNYLNSIHNLAKQYEGKMRILTGFESEYMPQYKDEMEILKNDSEIMVVGQHFTCSQNGEVISMHRNNFVPGDYELNWYSDQLANACKENFADIIAHPDLFMIHQTEFSKKDAEISHKICQAAEEYNKIIEINLCQPSANLFFDEREVKYPDREFWNIAKQYNLQVVFGLDYHGHFHPMHHDEVVDLACKKIGEDILSQLHVCTHASELKWNVK